MDKRNTEQDFISAFWQLYEKKPIEKKSINQLCQIAGYNRATFYNRFENIYALFDKAVYDILFPVKRNVFSSQNFYNLLQKDLMGSVLLTYFQQQDKYIELLFKRQNHYVLSDKIKKEFLLLISENVKPNTKVYEKIEILLEYQISAVLGVINYWYQKGKLISEQDILQKIYDISTKGVLTSLKTELQSIYEDSKA